MRKLKVQAIVSVQALFLVLMTTAAWAGSPDLERKIQSVDPGIVEQSVQADRSSMYGQVQEIRIGQDKRGGLTGGEGVEFELTGVIFDGNEVFADEELKAQVDQYLGLVLEVADLQKLADIITAYYHKHGYILTRAYLPPQTISGGQVIIAITEGRLGAVIVKGNERYKAETIRNVMEVVREKGALTGKSLERGLLLLMDYPGMTVKATLVRGKNPGTTDIVVEVTESKWWQVGLDYNNFGSEYVSQHRIGLNLTLLNPAGIGDQFGLRYMMGADMSQKSGPLWYLRADYSFPINYSGTRLGFALSRLHYEVGQELEVLDIDGTSDLGSIWVSHPIVRTRNFSWWADGGLDVKRLRSKMLDTQLYEEDLYNLRAGTHLEWLDSFSGRNIVTAALIKGMSDDDIRSRLDADNQFIKFEGSYRRFQLFPYKLTGVFSLAGQYATDRLPTAEELSLGGATTIRGYGQSDYSGDHGVYGTLELRYPIWKQALDWQVPSGSKGAFAVEAAAFTDAGRVWVKDNYAAELGSASLWGAGLGLRFAWSPYAMAKIEWAKAVSGDKPLDQGVEDNGCLYFQLSAVY